MFKKFFLWALLLWVLPFSCPVWSVETQDGAAGLSFPEETYESMLAFLYWFPGSIVKQFGRGTVPHHFCHVMGSLEYAAYLKSIPSSLYYYVQPTILGEVPSNVRVWEQDVLSKVLATSKIISDEKFLYKYEKFRGTDGGKLHTQMVAGRCNAVITKYMARLLTAGKSPLEP